MSTIRILIADDHPFFRQGLRRVCELHPDFEVVAEAGNGREAVEQAHTLQPDIILMDIQMPELDGIEATCLITARNPAARVIMLTVQREGRYFLDAIKAGARGYLLKDIAEQRLVEAVQAVCRGEVLGIDSPLAAQIMDEFRRFSQASNGNTEIEPLSEAEMAVLRLVAQGDENPEIADKLGLAERTVTNRLSGIYQKIHVNTRTQAALYALRQGWAPLHPKPD